MSQSSPICHLRCSRCKAKQDREPSRGNPRFVIRKYLNVMVIGRKGEGAICQCKTCGYKYVSRSRAALRHLSHWEKSHADAMLAVRP